MLADNFLVFKDLISHFSNCKLCLKKNRETILKIKIMITMKKKIIASATNFSTESMQVVAKVANAFAMATLVIDNFSNVFVPTFVTKVTEYLCSGWVFFSSDKFRLFN